MGVKRSLKGFTSTNGIIDNFAVKQAFAQPIKRKLAYFERGGNHVVFTAMLLVLRFNSKRTQWARTVKRSVRILNMIKPISHQIVWLNMCLGSFNLKMGAVKLSVDVKRLYPSYTNNN